MHPHNQFVLTLAALGAWYAVGNLFLMSRIKSAQEDTPRQPTLVEACDPLFDNVKDISDESMQVLSQCPYVSSMMLNGYDFCSPERRRAMEESYRDVSDRLYVAERQLRKQGCGTLPSFTEFYRRINGLQFSHNAASIL